MGGGCKSLGNGRKIQRDKDAIRQMLVYLASREGSAGAYTRWGKGTHCWSRLHRAKDLCERHRWSVASTYDSAVFTEEGGDREEGRQHDGRGNAASKRTWSEANQEGESSEEGMGISLQQTPSQVKKPTMREKIKLCMLNCVQRYGVTAWDATTMAEFGEYEHFFMLNFDLVKRWAAEVSSFVCHMNKNKPLKHFLNVSPKYCWGRSNLGGMMSVETSVTVLDYIVDKMVCVSDPNMSCQDKLQVICDVFDCQHPINTIFFEGRPKTGKTLICQALKNIVGYNLATDLNRMDERGGNTFAFSNLPDKRIIIAEEFNTGTDVTKLERLKLLLGGTPTGTNMKSQNAQEIVKRTPIFMTGNQDPLHPSHEAVHGEAFRRRIIPFNFDGIDRDHLESLCTHAEINPYAFKILIDKYNVELSDVYN